jgi:hypothetical protein
MTEARKYSALLVIILGVFLYLASTEVADRWKGTISHWAVVRAKAREVRTPEELEAQRQVLNKEHLSIRKAIHARSGRFDQSAVGAIECLNAKVRESGVRISSIVPSAEVRRGQTEQLGFTAVVFGGYHQIGQLVSGLEAGGITFQVRRLEIERVEGKRLKATIEASAIILSGRHSREE